MIDASLAFAFTAGLVAAVNPCGFAMLPAYLSFFVGSSSDADGDAANAVTRAIVTSLSLAVGFVAVFAVVGTMFNAGVSQVRDIIPWIVIVIGGGLIGLGLWLVSGRELVFMTPKVQRGGNDRTIGSMVLFGVSYATASLGCTLPLFLVAVVSRPDGFVSGLAAVLAYAVGMSLTITALTVSIALARSSVTTRMRQALPHVNRVSGVLLVLTGIYTVWFWVLDIRSDDQPGFMLWLENRSIELQDWVDRTGGVRIGLLLAMVVAGVVLAAMVMSDRSRQRARRAPTSGARERVGS